jgi:hypothetical protein
LIIILIKLFQSQLVSFLPGAVQEYIKSKSKLRADRQEHEQEIQRAERNLVRLRELSELSKESFTSEQLTALTSEIQVQLDTANEFIRRTVSDKLDIMIENQQFVLRELRAVNDKLDIMIENQQFMLRELRRNGNGRNKTGKMDQV